MQRNLVIFLFIFSLLAALFLTVISIGWYLIFFGLVAVIVIVLHVTAGVLSFKALPASGNLLLLSALCFVILALVRYDFDDVGVYTGLSRLTSLLEKSEEPYIELGATHKYMLNGLLVLQVILDILLFRKYGWRKKKDL